MSVGSLTLNKEEVARRGTEIYNRLKPLIEPDHVEEVIAIDVLSGDYEVNKDAVCANKLLRERHPEANVWFQRVGYGYLHSMVSSRREPQK